jgi:hypothetical protein
MPESQPQVLLETDVVERIRTIFLQPRPHVSIAEGTALLGWTRAEMSEAIRSGEIEVERTCREVWIWREELMAKALEAWPLETIEAALGAEAGDALPDGLLLTSLHVRLPRYHVAMLEHLAERHRTTVSDILTRELGGIASDYAAELSGAIPGFDAALQWPEGAGVEAGVVS